MKPSKSQAGSRNVSSSWSLHEEIIKALEEGSQGLAEQVISADDKLDRLEVEIDDEAVRYMNLRAPIASDLRLVIVGMKASHDLERVGDEATSIAKRASKLSAEPPLKPYIDLAKQNHINEIWVTEIGWTTHNPGSTLESTSPVGQAKYLLRCMFFYPLSCDIKVFTQYTWQRNGGFDMSAVSKAAYKNITALFSGADSTVSTQPFNSTACILSGLQGYSSAQTEKYLLVKNDKTIYLVYWLRIPQQDAFQKQTITISMNFPRPAAIASVKAYDVLQANTGTAIPFSQNGKSLVIKSAQIGDYPSIIEMTLK